MSSFFLDGNQDYLMQIISDADQHRMLFYKQPVAHWPSVWLYLIHSDEKTQSPCKITAAICAPKPLRASLKTEYKNQDSFLSFFPTTPTDLRRKVLSSSCPGWHCQVRAPSWHGVASTESRDLEPWLETMYGPHSSGRNCLCFWGNDFMSEKFHYCMILGLREKPRVHTGNLTTRTIPGLCCMSWRTQTCSSPVSSRVN